VRYGGETGAVRSVEDYGLLRKGVNVRRADPIVAVAAQMIPSQGVGDDDDEVHTVSIILQSKNIYLFTVFIVHEREQFVNS